MSVERSSSLTKVCAEPGCPELQPCEKHKPRAWQGSDRRARLPKNWERTRQRILRRDHRRCYLCGDEATEVDHIVNNDDHHDTNLAAICIPCHKRKTAREAAVGRTRVTRG